MEIQVTLIQYRLINCKMPKAFILIIPCLVFFISCSSKGDKNLAYSFQDSVLQEHLSEFESMPYFDSTEINYKVLRAYKNNDTAFFTRLHNDIEIAKKYRYRWDSNDTCIREQELSQLNVDEAYRFIYDAAFCIYRVHVTITKKTDSANLHFLIYQYSQDTMPCRVINEFDKSLSLKTWAEIRDAIDKSDFWGLKRDNGVHGVDGSSLTVIGYKKGKNHTDTDKINFVSRWEEATLREPLNLILKISGNKQGCFWIEEIPGHH